MPDKNQGKDKEVAKIKANSSALICVQTQKSGIYQLLRLPIFIMLCINERSNQEGNNKTPNNIHSDCF